MLAQFVLIVFGIFAVMSLVIDMGYVTLTRVQMQNVADAAAIEGVRFRDRDTSDAYLSDLYRRSAAADLVRSTFDEDLDPGDGDAWSFGAGPLLELTNGVGELNAMQESSVPDPHVYKPSLELNQTSNVSHGDMVSGTFDSSQLHGESPDYSRADFAAGSPVPNGASGPIPDGAFLVRLRRTNDFANLDSVAGVSSRGPTLPLLWGLGTTIAGEDPNTSYSVRHHGFTVRGTAIASARPALGVGVPFSAGGKSYRGITPFALVDKFVNCLSANATKAVIDPVTGFISIDPADCAIVDDPAEVGRFVDDPMDPTLPHARTITTIGQPLPDATAVACAAATPFSGYGPVYSPILPPLGTKRVVGYARINLVDDQDSGNPCDVVITRGVQLVASACVDCGQSDAGATNATGLLQSGFGAASGLTAVELQCVLHKNSPASPFTPEATCPSIDFGALLVPVLAR